ncbi:TetR/AcrR family transcriptional regulator [Curtobacterium herbarum]|uniref:TetR/AcrR family transcriptional regulator n=1 Tax=Curtobacterium herbarum TaxID=150122 RepID=A0ABN1Z884_9MICO|nr:TetR/AcrR family transcriptional regulator [Curtobacterium herbarum]MBM7475924.1 AcrR family transcriptional regulator [Curtobacterium herbarum]MCS6544507.1 TetR/AcrR family transcriptional regulator [Curtobacterium herbarum]
MTIEERRARERDARRRLITATARAVAEREGWDAVTTRRLSAEIEYSQPVIYKHFASLDEIADAVAVDGFAELADALRQARTEAEVDAEPGAVVAAVAHRYAAFAEEQPAVYDAMFGRPSRLRFGPGSSPALASAFAELRSAVEPRVGDADVELLTETLWAGLHGLVVLQRGSRLRPDHQEARITLLVDRILPGAPD